MNWDIYAVGASAYGRKTSARSTPKVGIFSDPPVRKDTSVAGLISLFSKSLKESKILKTLVNSNWLLTVNVLLTIFQCVQSKDIRKNIKAFNLVKIKCQ